MNTAKEYERILWIHNQIKTSKLNKSDYLFKFSNKERTFLRDIEKLKTHFNAPIEFNRDSKNYFYTDKTFELPVMLLNEQELFSLLVSAEMLEQYKCTPLYSVFNKVLKKLCETLSTDVKYFYPQVEVIRKSSRTFDWQILFEICKAIIDNSTLLAEYNSFTSMNITSREIDPYSVYLLDNEFYVVGYCYEHGEYRDFALSRFKSVTKTDKKFERRNFNIAEYATNLQWGVIKGGELCKVRFKVTRSQQQWVYERYRDLLKTVSNDNAWVTYEADIEVNRDFINWVLSLREEIIIESPDSLKKEIVNQCRKVILNYENI